MSIGGEPPKGGLTRSLSVAKEGLLRIGPSGAITRLSGTPWTVLYIDAAGDVKELALGAAGTVFVSNGPAAVPSFGDNGWVPVVKLVTM